LTTDKLPTAESKWISAAWMHVYLYQAKHVRINTVRIKATVLVQADDSYQIYEIKKQPTINGAF